MAQGSPGHNPQGGQILVLRGGGLWFSRGLCTCSVTSRRAGLTSNLVLQATMAAPKWAGGRGERGPMHAWGSGQQRGSDQGWRQTTQQNSAGVEDHRAHPEPES